jgi:lipopolysaccharide heptosyltransferase II
LIRLRLIGDVVFTTPAIGALRRWYPGARISYLVERAAAPVVAGNPNLHDVIVVERSRGWQRMRDDVALAGRLRRARFDVAVDFHGGPRSAWLTWATRAAIRIGYDLPGRRWAYTARRAWTRSLIPPRHAVLNQWDLLLSLAERVTPAVAAESRIADPARDPAAMTVDRDAASRVAHRLAGAGVNEGHRVIAVHVSAGNPFRRWPLESFAALAAALAREDPDTRIAFSSGPSEADAVTRVAEAARSMAGDCAHQILRCGEFDLAELRALVDRAALFVGGDSGPMHVASTSRTPVVALFGPTLPDRSMPWRDPAVPAVAVDAGPLPCRPCHQRRCEPGDFRCLTRLAPEQVLLACRRALNQESA